MPPNGQKYILQVTSHVSSSLKFLFQVFSALLIIYGAVNVPVGEESFSTTTSLCFCSQSQRVFIYLFVRLSKLMATFCSQLSRKLQPRQHLKRKLLFLSCKVHACLWPLAIKNHLSHFEAAYVIYGKLVTMGGYRNLCPT